MHFDIPPLELQTEALFTFTTLHNDSLIGIGCDILEITRFRGAFDRIGAPFLAKIFTDQELQFIATMKDPIPSLAARFAAKEALSKALGTGISRKLHWHDMQILKEIDGKPYVQWNQETQTRFSIDKTHLSLSHSHIYAVAFCALATA